MTDRLGTLNNDCPSLGAVLVHYRRCAAALEAHEKRLRDLPQDEREGEFVGATIDDLEVRFKDARDELELEASMFILASAEGALRRESLKLLKRRKKGSGLRKQLSRLLQETSHFREIKIDYILDAFAKEHGKSQVVGNFRQALNLRNWLAHGRYSNQPADTRFLDAQESWERCNQLLQVFGIL